MSDLTDIDRRNLRRCVELAHTAYESGDEPFGSLLVGADGEMLFEDHNRTQGGDQTRHPEFEIARWAGTHVATDQRPRCNVYTSGEHCPMCAAAHGWAGLGRIVYAVSTEQLNDWRAEWGLTPGPVAPLPVTALVPGLPVAGPAVELLEEMRELHRRQAERSRS